MGAALTYARRYALFALVGIAGEDDLDAPDLCGALTSERDRRPTQVRLTVTEQASNGSVHKAWQAKPILAPEPSATLRDQLVAEIANIKGGDDLALWAHRRLPAKEHVDSR